MAIDDNRQEAFRKLVAKTWADPEFLDELRRNPKRILFEAGLLESGIANDPDRDVLIVHHDKDAISQLHVVIPPKPAMGNDFIKDQVNAAFDRLARGGSTMSNGVTSCCCDISVAPSLFD